MRKKKTRIPHLRCGVKLDEAFELLGEPLLFKTGRMVLSAERPTELLTYASLRTSWRSEMGRGATHHFAMATMCRSEFFPSGTYNRLRSRRGAPLELWVLLATEFTAWVKEEVWGW